MGMVTKVVVVTLTGVAPVKIFSDDNASVGILHIKMQLMVLMVMIMVLLLFRVKAHW